MRQPRSRLPVIAFALLLAASFVTAPAHAADDQLIAAAKKEGQVVWYTTLVVQQIVRPMAEAFQQKYGIKVNYAPGSYQEAILRTTAEARANNVKGDVWDSLPAYDGMRAAGVVDSYKPQSAASFPDEEKDPAGYWTAFYWQVVAVGINTDQVTPKDEPKTYEDLLDPKWKGKMAWSSDLNLNGPVGFIGTMLMTRGEEKGMDYMRKLAAQKLTNIPATARVVLDQCIAGQYPVVLSIYNTHAEISAAAGAPVKWISIPPNLMSMSPMGLLKGAPHPNAAKLFLEYAMSDEGQKVLSAAGYVPANPNVPARSPTLAPATGHFAVNSVSPDYFIAHEKEWISIYKSLFQ